MCTTIPFPIDERLYDFKRLCLAIFLLALLEHSPVYRLSKEVAVDVLVTE